MIAACACAATFALLAVLVTTGWARLVEMDTQLSARAYEFTLAHGGFQDAALVVTHLGSGWTVTAMTAVVAVLLAARREWLMGWWLVLTMMGSALLSKVLKVGLERMRPSGAGELTSAHGFSFPSGHTQAATVAYVAVVLVVGWQVLRPDRGARLLSTVLVVTLVGAVGLSRIFLGAHWPSDVVGGWLSGSAWVLAATAALLSRLRAAGERTAAGLVSPAGSDDPGEQ